MKKLINKKTGEIAYLDLYTNTIKFSKSKGVYKAYIEKDPATNKISKITTSAAPIPPDSINEPIEFESEPINKENPTENLGNEKITEEVGNPTPSSYPHPKLSLNDFIKLYIETAIRDLNSINSHQYPIRPAA